MKEKTSGKLGRFRLTDDSMQPAGVNKGDVVHVKLGASPKQGQMCAAFTGWGEVMVRTYHRKPNGDVRLSTGAKDGVSNIFAPDAVHIFGPVVKVERRSN
jgi:SOS-response transcriptional repressor LexA